MSDKTLTPDAPNLGEPEVVATEPIVAPVEGITTEDLPGDEHIPPKGEPNPGTAEGPTQIEVQTRMPSSTFQVQDASGAVLVIEPEDDMTANELYLIQALITQMVSTTVAVKWTVLSYIHTHGLNRHFKVIHVPEGLIQKEEAPEEATTEEVVSDEEE